MWLFCKIVLVFCSLFEIRNHSVKFLQVSDSDEEDEENSGDEPSPRALRRLRQAQSSSPEKGRVTRSTAAEPSAASPARPKRVTRSSVPSPTRSDEQGKSPFLDFQNFYACVLGIRFILF